MTSASFKRLKAKSNDTLRSLKRLTSYNSGVVKGSMYKTRIKNAIKDNSYFDDMRECNNGKGKACFSIFCPHCQKVKQTKMHENYWEHFKGKYGRSEKQIRSNARFGTVLHSLVPVDVGTESLEQHTIEMVIASTKEIKETLLKIDRKAKKLYGADIWVGGGIHIELVDYDRWRFAELSGRMSPKQRTYNEFIARSSNNAEGHYFLVHTHFLCDLDGIQDDDFNELFKEHWNKTSRQTLIKRLTDTYETGMGDVKHELDTAFKNITNYCYTGSNHGLAYAKNWGNSGKVVETKIDAKGEIKAFASEVFDVDIEDELSLGHLRLLIQVHNELSKDNNQGLRVQVR